MDHLDELEAEAVEEGFEHLLPICKAFLNLE